MNLTKLNSLLAVEPKYRYAQVQRAIFQDFISDWSEVSNLPKALRENLAAACPLDIQAQVFKAAGKPSDKAVITSEDGEVIETVLIRQKDKRNTVCLSSQVGCPLGCAFCATGQLGFKRNLLAAEIVEQFIFWSRYLKKTGGAEKIDNVVFMGMGEPLLNYDNVISAISILNSKNCFNISIRKISVSTAGIPWAIKKLAKEKIKPNLAVSLHWANQAKRTKIMPIAKNHDLIELSKAIDFYIKATGQRVMFEYLMLSGINDTEKDALDLAKFVKQFKTPVNFRPGKNFYFVNLIAFNDFKSQDSIAFEPSRREKIAMFKEILAQQGIEAKQRFKFGEDIKGACGQLTHSLKHEA